MGAEPLAGRHQDDEKNIRLLRTVSGASRGYFPPVPACPPSSRARNGHLPRPHE